MSWGSIINLHKKNISHNSALTDRVIFFFFLLVFRSLYFHSLKPSLLHRNTWLALFISITFFLAMLKPNFIRL